MTDEDTDRSVVNVVKLIERLYVCCHGDRDEWVEAIQMVADKLAKQEEEGILCSPTTQIEIVNEEEMDTSISHHKRKVRGRWGRLLQAALFLLVNVYTRIISRNVLPFPAPSDDERLRLSEAARQRHLREGDPGEREGQWNLLCNEDPEEGGHYCQGETPLYIYIFI